MVGWTLRGVRILVVLGWVCACVCLLVFGAILLTGFASGLMWVALL